MSPADKPDSDSTNKGKAPDHTHPSIYTVQEFHAAPIFNHGWARINTDFKRGMALFGAFWRVLARFGVFVMRFGARHENLLLSVQKLDRFLTETDLVFPDQFLT